MQDSHAGKFTDAQLGVLADRNGRATGTLFQTCPLCGTDEVSSMEDHVIGHMRALALKSLPSYEEDDEARYDSESQQSSGSSAKAPSRSTLKNDGWDVWSSTDDTTTPNGEQPDTFASTTQGRTSLASSDPELPALFHQDEARGVLPLADYLRFMDLEYGVPGTSGTRISKRGRHLRSGFEVVIFRVELRAHCARRRIAEYRWGPAGL
ncbi:hypothetical protein CSHISOI_10123 [Colletotrichum shisoi]|uniref:Uncharacterized protein n=1 Tax=Colletotrichum shisoi TaxID=2078593 RepID=A0A5Q4BF34_9PEZI|nr:hypothetical protein CSHISOI_10123 [Colletotrichum shisoi]